MMQIGFIKVMDIIRGLSKIKNSFQPTFVGCFFVCGDIADCILVSNKYDRRVEIQFNKNNN